MIEYHSKRWIPRAISSASSTCAAAGSLPEPIIDPPELDEAMRGMPITRAASPDGRFAYTLYDGAGEHPSSMRSTPSGERHGASIWTGSTGILDGDTPPARVSRAEQRSRSSTEAIHSSSSTRRTIRDDRADRAGLEPAVPSPKTARHRPRRSRLPTWALALPWLPVALAGVIALARPDGLEAFRNAGSAAVRRSRAKCSEA